MSKGRDLKIGVPRWAKYLVNEPSRYRAAYGGRSSGKSHVFAELMIKRHMLKRTDSICGREYQRSLIHSAKRLLEFKIKQYKLQDYFAIRDKRIDAPYGGVIIFEGLRDHTADSIKSFEGFDIFWGEEANRFSQRSLDLVRPTIIRKKDAELWFSWNPYLPTDPVDFFFRGNDRQGNQVKNHVLPPGTILAKANYWNNPFLDENAKIEIRYDKTRDLDKYLHVWEGEYLKHSRAAVFHNWTIEEFEAPYDAVHRFGADFGFVHPATLIRSHIIGRKLFIDYEAYQVGCEIPNLPDLYRQVPDSDKWPIIADSSRPDTISYLRKNGFPKIYGSIKGKNSVEEGIEWLKSHEIIVHPRCKHTIDELTHYKFKVDENDIDPLTNEARVLPILEDKENHIIDPLRYSHEGHRRAQKQQETETKHASPIPVTTPYRKP